MAPHKAPTNAALPLSTTVIPNMSANSAGSFPFPMEGELLTQLWSAWEQPPELWAAGRLRATGTRKGSGREVVSELGLGAEARICGSSIVWFCCMYREHSGREPACQCRRCGFSPWVGNIHWRRKWLTPPVFSPRKSHAQRNLAGYSSWGCKESDVTEQLSTHSERAQGWRVSWGLIMVSFEYRMESIFLFQWEPWQLLNKKWSGGVALQDHSCLLLW